MQRGSIQHYTDNKDQGNDNIGSRHKEAPQCPLLRCSIPWDENYEGTILIEVPVVEVESLTEKAWRSSENGVKGMQLSDSSNRSTEGSLPCTPDKSLLLPAKASAEAWLAPGNVVWAKTDYNEWWPAEVMDETGVLDCSSDKHIGHVLVQFYGRHEYAWLDPGGDLSQFDYHYEERSKNPLESFQDALKKALCKHASKCPRMLSNGCSGEPKGSIQHDQPFETLNTPSSSGRKHENNEETSDKRKRKAKIHFDDSVDPKKPARRTRRLRIMRYLGLAPPLGSPFSVSHGRTSR